MTHAAKIAIWAIVFLVLTAATVVHAQGLPPDKLDQLVAPIALLPDDLLSQVLMASAYPLEIVEADRWGQANPDLNPTERLRRLRARTWDPSVTSLTAFPELLHQMSLNIEWTEALGEAFILNQGAVLAAVQRMRDRAMAAGTLRTTPQETVAVSDGYVTIAPTNPDVLYLPMYSPYNAYGPWYPTNWYYPWVGLWTPGTYGSYFTGNLVSFGLGVIVGDLMFGRCNWRTHRVWIDTNRYSWAGYSGALPYNNLNLGAATGGPVYWRYNGFHRSGVNFTTPVLQQRFGGRTALPEIRRNLQRSFIPSQPLHTPTFTRPTTAQPLTRPATTPRAPVQQNFARPAPATPQNFGRPAAPATPPPSARRAAPPIAPAPPAPHPAPGGARVFEGGHRR